MRDVVNKRFIGCCELMSSEEPHTVRFHRLVAWNSQTLQKDCRQLSRPENERVMKRFSETLETEIPHAGQIHSEGVSRHDSVQPRMDAKRRELTQLHFCCIETAKPCPCR